MKPMHPLLRKWFMIFAFFLMICMFAGGAALGALIGYINDLPPVDALDHYDPPEIARVYDRTGNKQISEYFTHRRQLIRINDVPLPVQHAFLAIEDERFEQHFGIDPKGVIRALKVTFISKTRTQGASTITQQVARNIVLDDLKRNWQRKIKEFFLALQIERNFPKEQILEFYLNHIFFGNNAYGIKEAAQSYFYKDVKDLTVPEAAFLAGLPQAPSEYSEDLEKARARRNQVLVNMRRNAYIPTDLEMRRYLDSKIELNRPPPPKSEAPYFTNYVSRVLVKSSSLKEAKDLGTKGYQVISTVDLGLQAILQEELSKGLRQVEGLMAEQINAREVAPVKKGSATLATIREVKKDSIEVSAGGYTATIALPDKLPYFEPEKFIKKGGRVDIYVANIKKGSNRMEAYLYDKSHVQGAAVLLDVHTGEILAMVGGDDYSDPANNGQYNRAFQGGRQPGSCWKPLLYAGALDLNDKDGNPRFTPSYVFDDHPLDIGGYSPKNYDGKHFGSTAFFHALVKSRNVPTVMLFQTVGINPAINIYNSFNLVTRPSDWKLDPYASMCLGTPSISPLALTAAYACFANHGIGYTPTSVKRLFSTKNAADFKIFKPEQYQVLSPQAAYMTARILENVITKGTAVATVGKWASEAKEKGRKLPEIACKTGTTNDSVDAWMCGFTPDLALGVFVGCDKPRSMGTKLTGGTTVGPMWSSMMERILATRSDWKMKFDVPEGLEFRDICGITGQLVGSGCGNNTYKNVAFKKGSAPNSVCSGHGGPSDDGFDPESGGYNQGSSYPQQQYPQQQQYQWPGYNQ